MLTSRSAAGKCFQSDRIGALTEKYVEVHTQAAPLTRRSQTDQVTLDDQARSGHLTDPDLQVRTMANRPDTLH